MRSPETTAATSRRTWALAAIVVGLLVVAIASFSCGGSGTPDMRSDASVVDASNGGAALDGGEDATESMRDGGTSNAPDSSTYKPVEATWKLPTAPSAERLEVTDARIGNLEATIPPQCYTKTEGRHNPCYTCHQMYDRREDKRLNQLDDGSLQGDYGFSDVGLTNHWQNLFADRSAWIDAISDRDIRAYVDADNYAPLSARLERAKWKGFSPDLEGYAKGPEAFDEHGLARDGSHWVAFNYKPFPGTFWPTNGATDDVLLRLPKAFRERNGEFNRDVYYVNLTLAELTLKQLQSAPIWPVDEAALGTDIDGDGKLAEATRVALLGHYVGDAAAQEVTFEQLPQGTEFMHSVRYLGVDDEGNVGISTRMKELRYMRKVNVLPYNTVRSRYAGERKEKLLGELPQKIFRGDEGFDNGLGWFVQGFIEDADGELRPQTYEEGLFCMGCHSAIGTTIDSTFSFGRKVTGADGWGYIDLVGMRDAPSVTEAGPEILNYLKRAGGGNEFRENPEMIARWFKADGTVDEAKVTAADVATLITPTPPRALLLNKAYTYIMRRQSYILGRDPLPEPARNVYRDIDDTTPPLHGEYRYYGWDLRLDWSAPASR